MHFKIEEDYIIPILGPDHVLVKKALRHHGRLKRLFEYAESNFRNLILIERNLVNHIRFEERVLFNKIQIKASQEQLQQIYASIHLLTLLMS